MKSCKATIVCFAALLLLISACSDDSTYTTSILSRPIDVAVTCATSADHSFVDIQGCDGDDVVAVSWILDADSDGLFVSTLPDGGHVDFNPAKPGYTPIPVGDNPVAVEASPDSRNIFVAIDGPAHTEPALVRISGDFYNLAGVAATLPLACPVVDMTTVTDDTQAAGYSIALLLKCASGSQIWRATPVAKDLGAAGDAFATLAKVADVPGSARWVSAGEGRVMVVSTDLPTGYEPWDTIFVFSGFNAGDSTAKVLPVVNDSSLVPMAVSSGNTLSCPAPVAAAPSGYVSGRPAMSPGGSFMYVPMSVPAGVAVFDGDYNRVDTHAFIDGLDTTDTTAAGDTWNVANLLAQWEGYKDIRMDSPVMGVSFVNVEDEGVRGLAWLYGGQIVRIIVDPTTDYPFPHRAETDLEDIESSAYMPVITYGGQDLERAIASRNDLPWFGNRSVVIPATDEEKYEYYGVVFNGDIEAEIPESWYFEYEGVIPGAEGACGEFAAVTDDASQAAWTLTPGGAVDFCGLGVEGPDGGYAGDLAEITLPVDSSCAEYAGRTMEFRITGVTSAGLSLAPVSATAQDIAIPAACIAGKVAWQVRASGQWVVRGSKSGFFHPWTADETGACIRRADADPIFTGRALTAMPPVGQMVVDSCPIADGVDSNIDWDATGFRNPMFSIHLIAGCRIGLDYQPVVIPPERGIVLRFGMETGRIPLQNDIGGLPSWVSVLGSTIFALDSSNGRMVVIDPTDMTISGSWF